MRPSMWLALCGTFTVASGTSAVVLPRRLPSNQLGATRLIPCSNSRLLRPLLATPDWHSLCNHVVAVARAAYDGGACTGAVNQNWVFNSTIPLGFRVARTRVHVYIAEHTRRTGLRAPDVDRRD